MPIPKIYWQRDPRWGDQHMGYPEADAGSTLHNVGCLVCELGQVISILPDAMNQILIAHDGYKHGGSNNLVDWQRLPIIFPDKFDYQGRGDYPTTPAPLADVESILNQQGFCLIYVDASAKAPGLQQHFVTITHKDAQGNYWITDPWYGDFVPLCPRYGKMPELAICGIIKLMLVKATPNAASPSQPLPGVTGENS